MGLSLNQLHITESIYMAFGFIYVLTIQLNYYIFIRQVRIKTLQATFIIK